jgi:integrase
MHRLYEKAMLWEMVDWQRNPMQLVEIKGISKRRKKPLVLTVEQFCHVLELLPQPYRTMVAVAQCTGLRAEEVLALEWKDIDFENLSMKVVRAVVHGRVKLVKTEYSEDELPLDPEFAGILSDWKRESEERARKALADGKTPSVGSELLFPSSSTGRHYHTGPIQQDYIRSAGCCLVPCPICGAGVGVGVSRMVRRRTASAFRSMRRGGRQPRSTAAWGGTPSATPTAPGWMTQGLRWGCSRS